MLQLDLIKRHIFPHKQRHHVKLVNSSAQFYFYWEQIISNN